MEFRIRGQPVQRGRAPAPQAVSNHDMYANRNRRPKARDWDRDARGGVFVEEIGEDWRGRRPTPYYTGGSPQRQVGMAHAGPFPDEQRAWARDGPPAFIDQSPLVDGSQPGFAQGERNTMDRFNPQFTPGDRVRMPQNFYGGEGGNFDAAAVHRFTQENPGQQNAGTAMGARGFSTNVYEDY